jgi:hypothetical protein
MGGTVHTLSCTSTMSVGAPKRPRLAVSSSAPGLLGVYDRRLLPQPASQLAPQHMGPIGPRLATSSSAPSLHGVQRLSQPVEKRGAYQDASQLHAKKLDTGPRPLLDAQPHLQRGWSEPSSRGLARPLPPPRANTIIRPSPEEVRAPPGPSSQALAPRPKLTGPSS